MTFGREKRLWLGTLALLAPLPLPFNQIVGWPALTVYSAAVALFLHRVWRGAEDRLPPWAMNLLGLLYLPLLVVDFTVFSRGRILTPLIHLALFTLAVKLFALAREKEKWHAVFGIVILFLAAMGTSVHPSVTLYLVGFLVLALGLLTRFAAYHVVAEHGAVGLAPRLPPLRGFLVSSALLSLLLAVPLFATLPRFRTPYLVAPGAGFGSLTQVAGFLDRFGLDVIGRVRNNRSVAMRLRYESPPPTGHEMRLKAATYDRFSENSWQRSSVREQRLRRSLDGFFRLGEQRVRGWVEIWQEPVAGSGLVLPVDSVALDIPVPLLNLDEAGRVSLAQRVRGPQNFRAGLAESPVGPSAAPEERGPLAWTRSRSEIGERVAALAAEVMGGGTPGERAARLERYLQREFTYSQDLLGIDAERPIEDFLFEHRRGHCEYFATSMVLMLRSQGVPARLAAGYLGGEFNPLEGYYIVRQSNAHAWVEAYLGEEGWRIFDPTPAAGRPQTARGGLGLILEQIYDYVLFRWDRYVLTYGFYDQVQVFFRLRTWWEDLRRRFGSPSAPELPQPVAEEPAPPEEPVPAPGPPALGDYAPAAWAVALAVLLALAAWLWRDRGRHAAARAYRRLREAAASRGAPLAASVPPLEVASRLAARAPAAAAPSRRVVDLYLEESFASRPLTPDERADLRLATRATLTALRRRGRTRRNT